MMCGTRAAPSLYARKQSSQGTVTHRTLRLHNPGNPRCGPRLPTSLAGVAVSVRVESNASRTKWRRATNVCSVGPRKREKELSMRCLATVRLAKRLHKVGSAYTVEAEKGLIWLQIRTMLQ